MRCWIDLSASALRHNFRVFSRISEDSQLVPIIKSNAYGHGLRETYQILAKENPLWLGVNYLEEADELRSIGFQGRILIVGPVSLDNHEYAFSLDVDIFVGDQPSLDTWLKLEDGHRPRIHLKFDTGMGRQGFLPDQALYLADHLKSYASTIVGLCSHFANVEDVINHQYADFQMTQFNEIKKIFEDRNYSLMHHIASSASTLLMKEAGFDLARVGIAIYGLWPSPTTKISFLQVFDKLEELKPVLSWKTEIALVKSVKEGSFVGYGCTFRAISNMKVAVLPVGYFEGYPRIASGRGSYVLVKGKRCPLVGRICMNMMMIDVTHISNCQAGEEVTLIGNDGNETISADELANWSETIHYELVTCLNPKIPRRIRD